MILRVLLLVFLLSIHGCSFASDAQQPAVARLGQVAIEIPAGFLGPHRSFPNKQSQLDVFVSSKDLPPALIQMMRVVAPDARSDLSEKDRYGAASDFLVGSLRIFSTNVIDWSRSSIEPVRLGGYLAAQAKWSGSFHGDPTTGVMYIVVFGKESYLFHSFGRADVPNVVLKSSIRAIEELRVDLANTSPKRTGER